MPSSRSKTNPRPSLERAAVGFRVKSGWAAAVLIVEAEPLPAVADVRAVQLADPAERDSTAPWHAALDLPKSTGAQTVARLVKVVERYSEASLRDLLAEYGEERRLSVAGIVAGSLVDPRTIANDHIRAHAEEGRLFRTVIVEALRAHGLEPLLVVEKQLHAEATRKLGRSVESLKKDLAALGRGAGGRWRADEKNAALAAWMAL